MRFQARDAMDNTLKFSLALALCIGLAACGVRGSLDSPEATPERTATAASGQGKPEGAAGKPHKDFLLDGLIR